MNNTKADVPRKLIIFLLKMTVHIIVFIGGLLLFIPFYIADGWEQSKHTLICEMLFWAKNVSSDPGIYKCPRCSLTCDIMHED